MPEKMGIVMQSAPPLESLPHLPLMALIKCLKEKDERSLAGVCRRLAAAVCTASKKTKLAVGSKTRWEGLRQICDNRTMNFQELKVAGTLSDNHDADSALAVMLKPSAAVPPCSFQCIRRVHIYAAPLPCLLPPNLARLCPGMQELKIYGYKDQYADVQPLPFHQNLRRIAYEVRGSVVLHLPSQYHTSEDPRRELPNVTSLKLKAETFGMGDGTGPESCVGTMLAAWCHQLTESWLDETPAQLQHCTRLQSLTCNNLCEAPNQLLPLSLIRLELLNEIPESYLECILQLPLLEDLKLYGFWNGMRKRPCALQQLEMGRLQFVDLAKLPIHSLKGRECLCIEVLDLPDPLYSNSLRDVQYAAHCVSTANIAVDRVEKWMCDAWQPDPRCAKTDSASAELLRVATSVVTPPEFYDHIIPVFQHQQITTRLIMWLSPGLHFVSCPTDARYQVWFWQALQCCSNLSEVYIECSYLDYLGKDMGDACGLALLASEYLVAVTRRPVLLTIDSFSFKGKRDKLRKLSMGLRMKLQEVLPICVVIRRCQLRDDVDYPLNITLHHAETSYAGTDIASRILY